MLEILSAEESRKVCDKILIAIEARALSWAMVAGMETPEGCRVEKAERVTAEVMGDGEL